MRRRITRALLATAAAGATIASLGLGAATSAGAATTAPATQATRHVNTPSGGPPIFTPPCTNATGFRGIQPNPLDAGGCAGYVGTGRDFRYAQAIIRIPAHPVIQFFAQGALPAMYVGLSSNDSVAALGLMTCAVFHHVFGVFPGGFANCGPLTPVWWAVGLVARQHGAILEDHEVALNGIQSGEGIKFAIYYNQVGNAIHMIVDGSGAGLPISAFFFNAHGAVYNHADALVDFSGSAIPVPPSAPLFDVRVTQFLNGAWTTASGQRGTFLGPWTTQPVSITFPNGAPPPGNTVTFEPSFLFNDTLGGGAGDAFGVWWRH
jgi:hypothetical protein